MTMLFVILYFSLIDSTIHLEYLSKALSNSILPLSIINNSFTMNHPSMTIHLTSLEIPFIKTTFCKLQLAPPIILSFQPLPSILHIPLLLLLFLLCTIHFQMRVVEIPWTYLCQSFLYYFVLLSKLLIIVY